MPDPLRRFSPPTQTWFRQAFDGPTDPQVGAWEAIARGEDALVVAPTGSGKTLAAFLWSVDRLLSTPRPDKDRRLRVLYVSPLKALAVDVERNLRSPLAGIRAVAAREGAALPDVDVAIRTGDTPQDDRRRMVRQPPDILITTPESLFLLLTSQAREILRHIDTVIIDEVHAVAGTKRGAHMALSLKRLDELLDQPAQRIGLSATVRPLEEVATFLGGSRPVSIVQTAMHKELDLSVVVPVEDMAALNDTNPGGHEVLQHQERNSIWPAVVDQLVKLIREHRSTIVFANSRRLAERLCGRINEAADETIARAHHGSVAREQRVLIEDDLKAGRLPCVVATSSLELGIDMGAVDLVVQVEAPNSVASGLQRIGRAGHHVDAVSRGVIFPKYRGDLVECATVAERMRAREIESIRYPRNPLDVLAQQIVAMVSMDEWTVDAIEKVVRRAAPFSELPASALEGVLDMLSGKYPSDAFADLKPRVTWDRIEGTLRARPGAQRIAVTSGGTIPDRGMFGVFLTGGESSRVGELDEEMVFESKPGDVFTLGATSWRIEDITRDRVLVSPAPGVPGKMPFWRGDALGRPIELGNAIGAFLREVASTDEPAALTRVRAAGLDENAANNLVRYVSEQREATGTVPDDRTIVVERFRDELGDWRVCIHSPFGARVHTPWALAIEQRVRERLGVEVQCIHDDDGIVVRLPEADEAPAAETLVFEPDEIADIVTDAVGGSAVFAGRFRECAARALLIPRRQPGKRSPLWMQRQRSADLLAVASRFDDFPIVLEAYRECLQDVFDLPALTDLMAKIQRREVLLVEVDTQVPSPFASALTFGYIGAFMYEGDSPIAERRAQALTLDRRLLTELLGGDELRELVDGDALTELELELQRLVDGRRARNPDELHDMLIAIGDLSMADAGARSERPAAVPGWFEELHASRRAISITVAGEKRWIAIEDAARYRDALGAAIPPGVPDAFLQPVADPMADLVSRYARTHGPFLLPEVGHRLGIGVAVIGDAIERLRLDGRVILGAFRPDGTEREWIDADVLRRVRRRSLAAFRKEVEPVPPEALGRFLPTWHGIGLRPGPDALMRAIENLAGTAVPASALERQVLAARAGTEGLSATLDGLTASGEVVWCGAGAVGQDDGWIALAPAELAPLLLPEPQPVDLTPLAQEVLDTLTGKGALFFRQIVESIGSLDDGDVHRALWDLVWAGHVTNDTLAPLRAMTAGSKRAIRAGRRPRRPAMPARMGPPTASGRWSVVPARAPDRTRRAHAMAEQLLRRHGVLTRNAVIAERAIGGFAATYQVLKAMEESGRCRRGYFVEGLGGAQFAVPGAVDRMRALATEAPSSTAVLLAAADPANPYGAALPWPSEDADRRHRPGRKAGASVVLVDGGLALYLEKGGRSVLTFAEEEPLRAAVASVAAAVGCGVLGTVSIERVNGEPCPPDGPLVDHLLVAGFTHTSKGLRLRA